MADERRVEQQAVGDCLHLASEFFGDLYDWHQKTESNGRIRSPNIVANALSPKLAVLSGMLKDYGALQTNKEKRLDYESASERVEGLASEIEVWRRQSLGEDGVTGRSILSTSAEIFDRRSLPRLWISDQLCESNFFNDVVPLSWQALL